MYSVRAHRAAVGQAHGLLEAQAFAGQCAAQQGLDALPGARIDVVLDPPADQ